MTITQSLRKLLGYLGPQRGRMALVVLASLLDMGLNAQLSVSFKYLIDKAIGEKNERILGLIVLSLAVSVVVVSLAGVWRDRQYSRIVGNLAADLRHRMFEHMQRLSLGYYSRTQAGEILSRFSGDLASVEATVLNGVPWGILPLLDILLSTILIFLLDWRLALVALVSFPLALAGPRLLSGRTASAAVDRRQEEAGLVSAVQENVAAQALVKAFGLERMALSKFEQQNGRLRGASSRLGFLMLVMERSAGFSTQILQVAVMGAGGYLVFRGQMTVGTFAAFQSLFVTLANSIGYVAQYLPQLSQAGGSMLRIEELLSEAPQVEDAGTALNLPVMRRGIELRDVTFSYNGQRKNLDGVSLRIPRGSSVAFVGPSGSGKSTILSLVMRFYDPAKGSVSIDGFDLKQVTQESLRAQTAVVFQENFLFETSIRENIRTARPSATDAEIETAARAAGIHDVISALPEGYDTSAGQGGKRFSGGQRQRLAIARALVRNPEILVLDEATSALDGASETLINETIARASAGRTVLSVTHRLGPVTTMDRIFFLDGGRVLEEGTHAELLARNGGYARLWQKQSGFVVTPAGDRAQVTPARLRDIAILSAVEEQTLAEIARSFLTELFPAGRTIVHEGDIGDKFYILVRGTVEVLKAGARVAVLDDGDYFGEMALLTDARRNASVRTIAECTCLVLAREHFHALMERAPNLRESMLTAAAARTK